MACLIIFSQLTKEKKSLDDKLQEMTQQLGDEEEKAKSLAKQKAKQDALIADLEERLRNAERVIILIPARFSRRTSSQSYVTDKHRGFGAMSDDWEEVRNAERVMIEIPTRF